MPQVEDPRNFVWDLFQRYKVITYLGDWFGSPDRIRLSYALDVDKIKQGLDRIDKFLRQR